MSFEEICRDKLENAKLTCEKLNAFSFENVVKRNNPPRVWTPENRRDIRKTCPLGCCSLCENINGKDSSHIRVADKEYFMKYICHGAHSLDFLRSIKKSDGGNLFDDLQNKPINWNYTPVLFLFENPSNEKKPWKEPEFADKELTIYEQNKGKCPSADWHWIYGGYNEDYIAYPNCFVQKAYGGLVASLVKMFRLANAYVTDAVKCSMNCGKDFLDTDKYYKTAVENCCVNILQKEVEILAENSNRLTIFAFGKRAAVLARKYLVKGKYTVIVRLPHPSDRNISDDYRKYIIFSKIFKTLTNRGNGFAAVKEFLDNDMSVAIDSRVDERINDANLKQEIENMFRENDVKVNSICIKPENLYVKTEFNYKSQKCGFCYDGYNANPFWAWNYDEKRYITRREEDLQCLYGLFKQCLGVDIEYNDKIFEL